MNILCFIHAACESPGTISDWAGERGHHMKSIHWYRGEELSSADAEADILVIMGGPMNINDHSSFPWLAREKQVMGK